MRTPNTACIICEKPLYRRPFELVNIRYAAFMAHRAVAQSVVGVTEAQSAGLSKGRVKGVNRRNGRLDTEATKAKKSQSIKQFYAANPDKAIERGEKIRGDKAYNWKGGVTKLNLAIRQLSENRKWMDAVKKRDGFCLRCFSTENLEAHHVVEIAELIERHGVSDRDQARSIAEFWDITNGETLCRRCHYAHHGRTYSEAA